MSDESSRSTRPSGQRRDGGAPVWWADLERRDLPDDGAVASPPQHWVPNEAPAAHSITDVAGIEGIPSRRRAWMINIAVAAVALLVLMLGLGVDSPAQALAAGLIFGVPLALVGVTVTVIARRSR